MNKTQYLLKHLPVCKVLNGAFHQNPGGPAMLSNQSKVE